MQHRREHGEVDARGDDRDDDLLEAALESRALWKELCEIAGDLAFETDRDGRFLFLWPTEILGWGADELIGRPAELLLAAADDGSAPFDPFRKGRPLRLRPVSFRRRDGGHVTLAVSARPSARGGVRGIGVDVTEAETRHRVVASSIRNRALVERILERGRGETLPASQVRSALHAIVEALGAEGAAFVRPTVDGSGGAAQPVRPATLHAAGNGWPSMADALESAASPNGLFVGERIGPIPLADGRSLLLAATARGETDCPWLLAWRTARDAPWTSDDRAVLAALADRLRHPLEADAMQRAVTRLARTDLLTGLPDRGAFLDEVGRRLPRLDRMSLTGTMLSIDLDGFASINASHGVEQGDAVLQAAAGFLRDQVRPTDLVARIGGDKFAAWMDGADGFAAAERADQLCRDGLTLTVAATTRRLTMSVGLASRAPGSDGDANDMLRAATMAMLGAKRDGKARWSVSREDIGT